MPFVVQAQVAVPVAKVAKVETPGPDSEERREMTRVQILLDRANYRPGKIDGLGGEFTQKAADRYLAASGMEPGTRLDTAQIPEPYTTHTVTEEDLQWIGKTAGTPPEQAKLKRMPYADPWELLAEMFHCDLNFMKELNPGVVAEDLVAGATVCVPDVPPFRMADVQALEKKRAGDAKARKLAAAASPTPEESGEAGLPGASPTPTPEPTPAPLNHRLVLLREPRLIEVYDAGDRMIACFPCTPGSSSIPVPAGTWKVTSNILMPYFRWDKSVLQSGVPSAVAYNIPPGPNNYVGIVWMGINRRSVGMHGTNNPDQIGRNQSSGCIRLANWDAFLLTQLVEKGTPVEVR
ncbi:MAG: L,D-transpeptidase family protein [Terrimicrobiaceae bacterium]